MVLRTELDQRQPVAQLAAAHLGQRPLDGNGIGLDEQGLVQTRQAGVKFTHLGHVASQGGRA